jgi:hypothetical protein
MVALHTGPVETADGRQDHRHMGAIFFVDVFALILADDLADVDSRPEHRPVVVVFFVDLPVFDLILGDGQVWPILVEEGPKLIHMHRTFHGRIRGKKRGRAKGDFFFKR